MASIPNSSRGRSFCFSDTVAAFVSQPVLPFSDILSGELVERVFRKHKNLFGRLYATSIVLWAFLSHVLRDGKEASCRSAVGRIASHLSLRSGQQVDPDTRDYCRARAKLSDAALRELSGEIAAQSEGAAEERWLWLGRHAKLIDCSTSLMVDTPQHQKLFPRTLARSRGWDFLSRASWSLFRWRHRHERYMSVRHALAFGIRTLAVPGSA